MPLSVEKQAVAHNHKCGFVAIVGLPNAGKSTLMNRYLEEKVSIVTPKPQTTRANVTSILSSGNYQIIFIDTPGILRPRYKMQEVMASFIRSAINESDVVLFMIDADKFKTQLSPSIVKLANEIKTKKVVIALNKVDIVKKLKLLEMIQNISELFHGAEVFPVSALKGDGTDELFNAVLEYLPAENKLYPDDIISTQPERFFVAEIIREALFLTMSKEIPYSSAVVIDDFKDPQRGLLEPPQRGLLEPPEGDVNPPPKRDVKKTPEGDVNPPSKREVKKPKYVIHASILVEKKSQKPIVIGKNGRTIKEIGTKARLGMEEFLGGGVYLDLHVKVRKDWRNKDVFLREIGLYPRRNY